MQTVWTLVIIVGPFINCHFVRMNYLVKLLLGCNSPFPWCICNHVCTCNWYQILYWTSFWCIHNDMQYVGRGGYYFANNKATGRRDFNNFVQTKSWVLAKVIDKHVQWLKTNSWHLDYEHFIPRKCLYHQRQAPPSLVVATTNGAGVNWNQTSNPIFILLFFCTVSDLFSSSLQVALA